MLMFGYWQLVVTLTVTLNFNFNYSASTRYRCADMKVLVLKAPKETLDDVDPYVDALRNNSIDAEAVEVLSFQYVNQEVLQHKVLHPHNYAGFIFTSPRGVVAVSQCLEGKNFDTLSWSALPTYVVGEGTAKVVQEKLGLASSGQECGSAQHLAQFICRDVSERGNGSTKPLLFPSADLKRNLLQDVLSEAHISIDVVTSYKTIPHPEVKEVLERKFSKYDFRPDSLVFFSPSGVHAVLPQLSVIGVSPDSLKMIAIGPTTESALQEQGQLVYATASSPSPSGLVHAIKAAQCPT